tara:strand:+ start:365 stop:682 length:318 start_codon:yes stop_codon:yes gene_type:complete
MEIMPLNIMLLVVVVQELLEQMLQDQVQLQELEELEVLLLLYHVQLMQVVVVEQVEETVDQEELEVEQLEEDPQLMDNLLQQILVEVVEVAKIKFQEQVVMVVQE